METASLRSVIDDITGTPADCNHTLLGSTLWQEH